MHTSLTLYPYVPLTRSRFVLLFLSMFVTRVYIILDLFFWNISTCVAYDPTPCLAWRIRIMVSSSAFGAQLETWRLEFLGGARDPLPRLSLLSPSQHLISLSSLSHSVFTCDNEINFQWRLTDLIQRSAKRRGCLLTYSQAKPRRKLTQPSPRLIAEPCIWICIYLRCIHCNKQHDISSRKCQEQRSPGSEVLHDWIWSSLPYVQWRQWPIVRATAPLVTGVFGIRGRFARSLPTLPPSQINAANREPLFISGWRKVTQSKPDMSCHCHSKNHILWSLWSFNPTYFYPSMPCPWVPTCSDHGWHKTACSRRRCRFVPLSPLASYRSSFIVLCSQLTLGDPPDPLSLLFPNHPQSTAGGSAASVMSVGMDGWWVAWKSGPRNESQCVLSLI